MDKQILDCTHHLIGIYPTQLSLNHQWLSGRPSGMRIARLSPSSLRLFMATSRRLVSASIALSTDTWSQALVHFLMRPGRNSTADLRQGISGQLMKAILHMSYSSSDLLASLTNATATCAIAAAQLEFCSGVSPHRRAEPWIRFACMTAWQRISHLPNFILSHRP